MIRSICFAVFLVCLCNLYSVQSKPIPMQRSYGEITEFDRNDYIIDLLEKLREVLIRENQVLSLRQQNGEFSKRGLDLGLGRGFSGSQAAKHLMGLAAANFEGGPGRKKRSAAEEYQTKEIVDESELQL